MDRIHFSVNGIKRSVGSEVDSEVTLNDYLRKHLNLRGTKYMCREGGCGACVVAVTAADPATSNQRTFSVNSCLVSITSCKDWEITTIEEIGHRGKGYHPIQKTLAEYNGTQCGYCSPGWVMSMYSLMKREKDMKMLEIEDSFGSNTCRCTGFRPILDAFKSFASDALKTKSSNIGDMEDLSLSCKGSGILCKQNSCEAEDWCVIRKEELQDKLLEIDLKDKKKWFRANVITDIFDILDREGEDSYMLVAGNTSKGIHVIDEYPDILIDVSGITALQGHSMDGNLNIRGGTTLSDVTEIFKQVASEDGFKYLDKFFTHMKLVAHIPVKNIGTIAGNLMIKNKHNNFPSDIFLLLETVGATLNIQNKTSNQNVNLQDFLKLNMKGNVIVNIILPPLKEEYSIVTYKIMPRSQNAHALVSSGFLYKFKSDKRTVSSATIVYQGLSLKFVHAENTENYLRNKDLFNNDNLQGVLAVLQSELIVESQPPEPSVEFRKKLALGLFYKSLLEICPTGIIGDSYKSGAINLRLSRPVSHGTQFYDTNETIWPLGKPMPKVEALIQCAGEAPFIDDIHTLPREVFAAFVLSTVAVGEIESIDPSSALDIKGVISFFKAEDIPGDNLFNPTDIPLLGDEEVLCSGTVKYFNQPLGIIVAETEQLANKAAKLVKVTYKNIKNPVLSIAQAKRQSEKIKLFLILPATDKRFNTKKVLKGSGSIFGQVHYTMETHVCVVKPSDDGLEVALSTQWMDRPQIIISRALKINQNRINMSVRRVGGAFGGKATRAGLVAVGCSLVSYLLNRPCRFVMPLTSVMRAIGKRLPCTADYEVGVSSSGEIQYLQYNIYEDNGYTLNEPVIALGVPMFNIYKKNRWTVRLYNVMTDTAKNTWCRSPGSLEQIAMNELIMEQISYEMSLDPINVRRENFNVDGDTIIELIETLKRDADYDKRREDVKSFNENNKWKKRGLRFTPMRWPVPAFGSYGVTMTVYHGDGSVVITHGGIEMGQGINTKIIQVCAYTLNLPIEKIKVKASNVLSNPNADGTGGSITSEYVCNGIIKCCQILLGRLAPIKIETGEVVWENLIKMAHSKGVNLFTSYNTTPSDMKLYSVHGVCIVEVEVDILTGEIQILRVDLLEDVGQSLNPEVDVGQIEGAFIMGLGYWTCENLIYDENTGELLTDRSWSYHVPLAKDIPIDFRIYFKRNSFNSVGILGSKATGEPAICLSVCVAFAIREAITAARADKGIPTTTWYNIDGPCTNENIVMRADCRIEDFKLY